MAIEEPPYIIERKADQFELRAYSPYLVAEVTVSGTREVAINQGFRLLANYIFGANTSKSKIAMTAPVTQAPTSQKIAMTAPVTQVQSGNEWRVRFSMPSSFTMQNIPTPNDRRVKIIQEPAKKFAVIRFSGLTNETDIQKRTEALNGFIAAEHLRPNGEPILARYDPPWTIWFMRRNEVMIEVN